MPRYFPRHILKEGLKVPTLSKPKITDISLMLCRYTKSNSRFFSHHSFLYNLQREGIPYAANKLESVLGERCNKTAYACTCFFSLETIVHQHIITLDDVKTGFINRKTGQLLTGQPGTQNDETFPTAGGAFLPCRLSRRMYSVTILVHHLDAQFGIGYREPRITLYRSSVKQHSAAHYFFLVLVNAVKILVERRARYLPDTFLNSVGEDYSQR